MRTATTENQMRSDGWNSLQPHHSLEFGHKDNILILETKRESDQSHIFSRINFQCFRTSDTKSDAPPDGDLHLNENGHGRICGRECGRR